MEKLKDIFEELKNRTTSPFLVSFGISFLLYNWKIPIGLFTDIEILKTDGYTSYIDLIQKNIAKNNSIETPIYYAIGYTLLYPFIKLIFIGAATLAKRLSTDTNILLSKSGKVPVNKYLVLRESYLKKEKQLDEILSVDNQYVRNNLKQADDIRDLQNINKKLTLDLKLQSDSLTDLNFLEGQWKYYSDSKGSTFIRISIYYDTISIIKEDNSEEERYKIQNFYHNRQRRSLIFCRYNLYGNSPHVFHTLSYNDEHPNYLDGLENSNQQIKYVKI